MINQVVSLFQPILLALLIATILPILQDNPQRAQTVDVPIAALVIDMQPRYLRAINEREKKREIANILKSIDFCYERGIPLYAVEMQDAGETVSPLKEKLDDSGAIYITKDRNSSFEGTDLEKELRRSGINTIFLMGVNASVCVKETADAALDRGFSICTSRELIAEPKVWHRGVKTYESVFWFSENGVYCDRFGDLLLVLERSMNDAEALTPLTRGAFLSVSV